MEIGEEPEGQLEVLLRMVAVVLGSAGSGLAERLTEEKGGLDGLEKCLKGNFCRTGGFWGVGSTGQGDTGDNP